MSVPKDFRARQRTNPGIPLRVSTGLRALGAAASLLVFVAQLVGCGENYEFYNVAPVVEALGPVCVDGTGRSWVYLSVIDYDGDNVDVSVEVSTDGQTFARAPLWGESGEEAALPVGELSCGGEPLDTDLAPTIGYGTNGFIVERNYPGALHVVVLNTSEFDGSGSIRVRATPDDREAGAGIPVITDEFSPEAGTATSTTVSLTSVD